MVLAVAWLMMNCGCEDGVGGGLVNENCDCEDGVGGGLVMMNCVARMVLAVAWVEECGCGMVLRWPLLTNNIETAVQITRKRLLSGIVVLPSFIGWTICDTVSIPFCSIKEMPSITILYICHLSINYVGCEEVFKNTIPPDIRTTGVEIRVVP
ncbi:hypothetical protein HNY73_013902 [Argiope bruennichi]|uniref:Uncharacterized protein n=1 Tax=Argiope bruennichi TaxID=94029 RepID=A0A8T0EMD6_ARGBR|nr:hypothetical protein HNY73_013902 [Argiope bruennichi]